MAGSRNRPTCEVRMHAEAGDAIAAADVPAPPASAEYGQRHQRPHPAPGPAPGQGQQPETPGGSGGAATSAGEVGARRETQ